MSDTEKFLDTIVSEEEKTLNPTPFIQSTHNTIAGQLALILKCQNYNLTYVHRGFSFETALLDAEIYLQDNPSDNLLIGAVDSITPHVNEVGVLLGHARNSVFNPEEIVSPSQKGAFMGEGAAFFTVSGKKPACKSVQIVASEMVYKPSPQTVIHCLDKMLHRAGVKSSEIDLLMLGNAGDQLKDSCYTALHDHLGALTAALFKTAVGDYSTSVGPAMWIGYNAIINQSIHPDIQINATLTHDINTVLIYNHFRGNNHSLILLRGV